MYAACQTPSTKEHKMKRFHVHVSVTDLDQSIGFYSVLFGSEPSVRKPDYAKWMLDDPHINFAISERTRQPGINHLGFQVEDEAELDAMHARLVKADRGLVEETGATCCYATSDKYWITDPQGVAWETFRTLASAPIYGEDIVETASENSCCMPASAQGAPSVCGTQNSTSTQTSGCCATAAS
jgi:catechol 2,3-dioxygenase-like lactoylglutathione lyase family enzyme